MFIRLDFSCFLYLDVSGRFTRKYALPAERVGDGWYYCHLWKGPPKGDDGDWWSKWDGKTGIVTKEVSVGQEIPIQQSRKGPVEKAVVTAIRKSNLRGWYTVTITTERGKRWIMVREEHARAYSF